MCSSTPAPERADLLAVHLSGPGRAAILKEESAGNLDPNAGNDLDQHLDQVPQSLAQANTQDAAHKTPTSSTTLATSPKGGHPAAPRSLC